MCICIVVSNTAESHLSLPLRSVSVSLSRLSLSCLVSLLSYLSLSCLVFPGLQSTSHIPHCGRGSHEGQANGEPGGLRQEGGRGHVRVGEQQGESLETGCHKDKPWQLHFWEGI